MMKQQRIIDAHCFIGRWVDRPIASDARTLLAIMKRNGVSNAVVMTTNRAKNDYVRKVVSKYKSKFLFAFWFDPRDPKNLEKLRKFNEDGSVNMVKIHPSHVRTRLDDALMEPCMSFCEEARLPVLVHCGRWQKMSGYRIALDVAEEFPKLNLLLAHMGGVTRELRTKTIAQVKERKIENAYLVTSGPISTEPGHDILQAPGTCPPDIIELAVRQLGSKRVIFGSDYPFGLEDQILKCVFLANIGKSEHEDIVFRNAHSLLVSRRSPT
jgi:predicted TIM-barrel fold metal-dependent hydrolase